MDQFLGQLIFVRQIPDHFPINRLAPHLATIDEQWCCNLLIDTDYLLLWPKNYLLRNLEHFFGQTLHQRYSIKFPVGFYFNLNIQRGGLCEEKAMQWKYCSVLCSCFLPDSTQICSCLRSDHLVSSYSQTPCSSTLKAF